MPTLNCGRDARDIGDTGVRARAGADRRLDDAGRGGGRPRSVRLQPLGRRAHGARIDGFDATTDLTETLNRAADIDALIVLAVPMPALPAMLAHIREMAPGCPLTDVTSVKGAVLDAVTAAGLQKRFVGGHPMTGTEHSGWAAATAGCSSGTPWVISVDDHVDPIVWSMVMTLALDCGAVVVPAKSDEHDAAAAAISHLPHLLAEALAVTAAEVPLAFALAAGSFRDGTRVAGSPPDLVRAMCEGNAGQLLPRGRPGHRAARSRPRSLACQIRWPNSSKWACRAYAATTVSPAGHRRRVIGAENWREELAAAGRAGGVIRSALPSPG